MSSGASNVSGPARTASAFCESGSSLSHFTATEASTIRLIVVAVFADQGGRINRRIRAHRPDTPRLFAQFSFVRPNVCIKRFACRFVDGRARRFCLVLQATRSLSVHVADQYVHHEAISPLMISL